MLANLEEEQIFSRLKELLKKKFAGKKTKSSSVALTDSGSYFCSQVPTKNHLLNITSEQGALAISVANKDPKVKKVITMVDSDFEYCPIVSKVLIDHYRRTGQDISYEVYDVEGKKLFSTESAYKEHFYQPEIDPLEKIRNWGIRVNKKKFDFQIDKKKQLKDAAKEGALTHFSSNTKSCYGAAVLAEDMIYFAGVYSSFDHRVMLHAEMLAIISALMDSKKITDIAVVSTKFREEPTNMCGCCRQFAVELLDDVNVYAFSYNTDKTYETKLSEYLPAAWVVK